jgi:UDP-glucose 4-epimerase
VAEHCWSKSNTIERLFGSQPSAPFRMLIAEAEREPPRLSPASCGSFDGPDDSWPGRPMPECAVVSAPVVVIGSGFIGRAAAEALRERGRPTVIATRRSFDPPSGLRAVAIDLTDVDALSAIIRPGTDVVFAAGSSVPAGDENDPRGSVDALVALIAALEAVRRTAGASLLFVSSGGAVYGEPDAIPVGEDHPLRPLNAYGAAKAAAETYIGYYVRRYGVHATALRCGNAYGPGQVPGRGQGLVGELIAAASNGRPVEVWGDGSVQRDFVYVGDIAGVITTLCGRRDLPLALNVGSGRATSVNGVIATVSDVLQQPIAVVYKPSRAFDVQRVALDIGRLRSLIAFDPIQLRDGVGLTGERMASRTVA